MLTEHLSKEKYMLIRHLAREIEFEEGICFEEAMKIASFEEGLKDSRGSGEETYEM